MGSILSDRKMLEEAIQVCKNKKECLIYLGLRAAGGNYKTLDYYCNLYNLPAPCEDSKTKTFAARKANTISWEDVFCEGSKYSNRTLIKKKLFDSGMKDEICEDCGVGNRWNNKPLVLQLEHKNGIPNDHRLENLKILCPNCHSQTSTYCGRKLRKVTSYPIPDSIIK